jgi:hypothetical protein
MPSQPSFQVRSKSVSPPFLRMGGKWDLQGNYLGLRREQEICKRIRDPMNNLRFCKAGFAFE